MPVSSLASLAPQDGRPDAIPVKHRKMLRIGPALAALVFTTSATGGFYLRNAWNETALREALLPELEAQVRQSPSDGRALALLGGRLAEAGRYAEAEDTLYRAAGAGEGSAEVWLTWAASCAARGDVPKAIGVLQIGKQRNAGAAARLDTALSRLDALPVSAPPHEAARAIAPEGTSLLAHVYAQGSFLNRWAEACARSNPETAGFATREKWARERPEDSEAQRLWAEALTRNRRYSEAIEVARRAVSLKPDSPEARVALGDALFAGGASGKAGIEYTAALKIRRDWLPALRGMGRVALEKKLLPIAVDVYERAVKLAPDDADLWVGLGRAHYNHRLNYARALEGYQTAERLAPGRTDYFADYSTALRANFQDTRAEELLRRRLKAAPDDAESLFLLGLVLQEVSPNDARLNESEAVLRKSVALAPNSATEAHLGKLLLERNKPAEAARCLEHAAEGKPYNAVALASLPRAYQQAGERVKAAQARTRWRRISTYIQAEAALNDAVRRNPLAAGNYKKLAALYESAGETQKAKSQRDILYVLENHRERAAQGLPALVRGTNLTTGVPDVRTPQALTPK